MKPFHDSMIWQLNRDYYQDIGIDAWSSGEVPHNITSNSFVGKTYAALIFAMLKDLARKEKLDTVYILELGTGHGRLAFHVLKHLEKMKFSYRPTRLLLYFK
jgi:SAM-dependent MidA family methyltransferase